LNLSEVTNLKPIILICSCDRTSDVALHMLTSVSKYTSINDFKSYIGCDLSKDFPDINIIETPPSNWKKETIFQLKKIKEHQSENPFVLILLDDFVLNKKVDSKCLRDILNEIYKKDIKYLVLNPTYENIFYKLKNYYSSKKLFNGLNYFPIRINHPYYYSLQSAFWDIDYLIESIERSENIWNFETLSYTGVKHYSLTTTILSYRHIVEKGKWDFGTKKYCEKYIGFFNPGDREFRKFTISIFLKHFLSKYILFPIFGYFFLRLRNSKLNS
jgi:hypothetical protein